MRGTLGSEGGFGAWPTLQRSILSPTWLSAFYADYTVNLFPESYLNRRKGLARAFLDVRVATAQISTAAIENFRCNHGFIEMHDGVASPAGRHIMQDWLDQSQCSKISCNCQFYVVNLHHEFTVASTAAPRGDTNAAARHSAASDQHPPGSGSFTFATTSYYGSYRF